MTEEVHRIEISERQHQRFERVKSECTDDELPEPTDDKILKSLIDTWDAVDKGFYSGESP